ncbi:dTDP-4-dehydrorhamnose reductase [Altererythrobacter insulae]|nr:dTDP-4-dehydrorhamnose reductase [Altererythrobacter insulae]
MKVLLIGATGQIGSALSARVPPNWEIVAPSRRELDLMDLDLIRDAIAEVRPAWVINAAAYTNVELAERERHICTLVNAKAPAVMAEAVAKLGGKLLQISTDYVFDGFGAATIDRHSPANPLCHYGQTKLEAEHALRSEDVILRTSWVYSERKGNFVTTMLDRMRNGAELRVVSDQTGAPTYAESVAMALVRLVESDASGKHHYTDMGRATWHEFASEIANIALEIGLLSEAPAIKPVSAEEFGSIAPRPPFSVLNCADTYSKIELEPPKWRENLRRCLMAIRAAQLRV